jgi:hypothetical protein
MGPIIFQMTPRTLIYGPQGESVRGKFAVGMYERRVAERAGVLTGVEYIEKTKIINPSFSDSV